MFQNSKTSLEQLKIYPCEALASNKKILHRKKFGFFKIDEAAFLDVVKTLNMIPDDVESRIAYKRHPFVYLVEAADDICYSIIDFEDAHRLGILSYEEVRDNFLNIIKHNPKDKIEWVTKQADLLMGDLNESIAYLRAKSIIP